MWIGRKKKEKGRERKNISFICMGQIIEKPKFN